MNEVFFHNKFNKQFQFDLMFLTFQVLQTKCLQEDFCEKKVILDDNVR